MIRNVVTSLRDVVLSFPVLIRILLPLVNVYRHILCRIGSNIHEVHVGNVSARFQTETFEEIRHFHPVLTERDEVRTLLEDLREEDVFYDVGAHIGIYTCIVGQLIDNDNIKAFEPHPANVQRLESNMELNGVTADVFPYALSDSNGTIELGVDNHNPGAIGHMSSDGQMQTVTIETIRGTDLIRRENLSPPTVIKIDVEGAELKVLRGLLDSLNQCRLIYCEVSDALEKYGDSEQELYEFLRKQGYEIETVRSSEALDHADIKAYRDLS